MAPKESEPGTQTPKPGEKSAKPIPLPPGSDPALAAAVSRIEDRLAAIERQLDGGVPGEAAPATEAASTSPRYSAKFPPPHVMLGNPLSGYVTTVLLCLIAGVIIASPWVIYQIWAFVGVGLHPHERRFVNIYGPMSFLLFVCGGALFYFYLLPVGLAALMSPTSNIIIDGIAVVDSSFLLRDYFNFVAMMTLVFGLVFETPLVVMFLARTGIIPLSTLARQQKAVILIIAVVAALLTPTQDPVSMAAMGVPLLILYEFGLLLAWLAIRRAKRREAEDEEPWGEYEKQNEQPWQHPDRPASASGAAEPPAPAPETVAAEGPPPDPEEDPYAEHTRREQELYGHPPPAAEPSPQTTEPPPQTTEPPQSTEPPDEAAPPATDDAPPPPDHGLPPEERMK
ncbi:MAG: preprotein translocase subunit TatC [Planctomycetes bacterium]|nr:preprotein translocase subunit TatC [Planctomycetota bacterium]